MIHDHADGQESAIRVRWIQSKSHTCRHKSSEAQPIQLQAYKFQCLLHAASSLSLFFGVLNICCGDCLFSLESIDSGFNPGLRFDKCEFGMRTHELWEHLRAGPVPSWVLDHYRFEGVIRAGTVDAVYYARSVQSQALVAVKLPLVPENGTTQDFSSFFDQARDLAQFVHPCVVPVNSVGQFQGVPFLTCEINENFSLLERTSRKPLTLWQVIGLISE